MSKKRYIDTIFWRDEYISNLDPSEKLLYLYLLTNPDTNVSGIYQLPVKIISADTGFDREMVIKILDRFQKDGKIECSNGWIKVVNFVKHQNTNSPLIQKAIETELKSAPNDLKYGIDRVYDSTSLSKLNQDINQNKNKFTPPTEEEIQAYLTESNITSFSSRQFIDFYESKGWMIGKNKMKSWKAAVRTWAQREHDKKPAKSFRDRNAAIDELPHETQEQYRDEMARRMAAIINKPKEIAE